MPVELRLSSPDMEGLGLRPLLPAVRIKDYIMFGPPNTS